MSKDTYRATKFIKCQCNHCGGLLVEGIEINYTEYRHKKNVSTAHVILGQVKKAFYGCYRANLWERIKLAWKVLRGKECDLYYDDIVLDKQGMTELQQVCTDMVDHWPTLEDLTKPRKTLEEFYAEMQDQP